MMAVMSKYLAYLVLQLQALKWPLHTSRRQHGGVIVSCDTAPPRAWGSKLRVSGRGKIILPHRAETDHHPAADTN